MASDSESRGLEIVSYEARYILQIRGKESLMRIVCVAANTSRMVFLDPFKDLLLGYNSCCKHEGLPASQNIRANYQYKALVPQRAGMFSTLGSIQNSKQQHSGGSKTLASALFNIGSMLREEKHQRLPGKRQLHCHMGGPSTWFPQTTVGTQLGTGQSLL